MKTAALLVGCVLLLPVAADAQQVHLEIRDGRVTLEAQNVPVRQILAEWARVGGATVVNAEKIVGGPVTLQLSGVPERQALDSILRNVSGYMLAARQPEDDGISEFDRILILPTSSAPRASSGPGVAYQPGMNRPMPMPVPQPTENFEPDIAADEDPVNDVPDGEGEINGQVPVPAPGMRQPNPNVFPNAGQVQVQPFVPPAFPGMPPQQNVPQQFDENGQLVQPGISTGPGNPFGVPAGASQNPGVITPVPQQPTTRGTRPPSSL